MNCSNFFELFMNNSRTGSKKIRNNWIFPSNLNSLWTVHEQFKNQFKKNKNLTWIPRHEPGSCFQLLYFVFIIVWAWHLHPSVFAFFYSVGNKQLAFTIDLPSWEKYGSTVLVVPLILFLLCLLWLPPLTNFNVIFRVSYFGRSFGQPTVFWNFTSWVSGTRPGPVPFLSYCFLIPPSDKPQSRYSELRIGNEHTPEET